VAIARLAIGPNDILGQDNVARVCAKLGNFDPAFDPLERLLPHASHATKSWIKVDSDFDRVGTV
jgi:adenylate cyclase